MPTERDLQALLPYPGFELAPNDPDSKSVAFHVPLTSSNLKAIMPHAIMIGHDAYGNEVWASLLEGIRWRASGAQSSQ